MTAMKGVVAMSARTPRVDPAFARNESPRAPPSFAPDQCPSFVVMRALDDAPLVPTGARFAYAGAFAGRPMLWRFAPRVSTIAPSVRG